MIAINRPVGGKALTGPGKHKMILEPEGSKAETTALRRRRRKMMGKEKHDNAS